MYAGEKRKIGEFKFAHIRHITDMILEVQLDINGILNLSAQSNIAGQRYKVEVHGTTGKFKTKSI